MVMSKAQWDALQRRLPAEDRTSYEEYLASQGMVAPTPTRTAARESGTIGATSIASQLTPAITEQIRNIPTPTALLPQDNPPATGLKTGYEWYKFNLPGGGFEWRQRPTRETLAGAFGAMGAGGGTGGDGGAGGTGATAAATEAAAAAEAAAEEKRAAGQSAFNLLREQFSRYGLEGLLSDVEQYIKDGLSPAEFTLRLRSESKAYQRRFAANEARIKKGLRALSEAEYIGLEDQYQDVMRRYGLPASYYARGDMGRQEGFEKFIAGDVSPVELEDRVQTAQRRVINAAPQIKDALMQYYGGEINNGDILAYVLDPEKAIENIKRKVTAAEIGGAASRFGLGATRARAEELGTYGVTGEQAQAGFEVIGGGLERGRQLSAIYGGPSYTQEVAETELFKLPTSTEARKQRERLIKQERATFGGATGVTGGALARDRAGAI